MRKPYHLFFIIAALAAVLPSAAAQEVAPCGVLVVTVPASTPAPEAWEAALSALVSDGRVTVDSVLVEAWTSPAGNAAWNAERTRSRALETALAVRGLPGLASAAYRAEGRGEDWDTVLRCVDSIRDHRAYAYRARLKAILDREGGADPDRREWLVRQVSGGRAWDAVREECYASCERVTVTAWYTVAPVEPAPNRALALSRAVWDSLLSLPSPAPAPAASSPQEGSSPRAATPAPMVARRVALRTNLLLPALNAGLDVALGRRGRTVLSANVAWPWLRLPERWWGDGTWCCEAMALSLGARWMPRGGSLDRGRGTGPVVGVSATAAYFDLCLRGRGAQGEAAAASLDLGWSFPAGRCRLEALVGGGFMYSRLRDYHMDGGRAWRDGAWHRDVRWWGPVKAAVTLRIPLGGKGGVL